jgi:hypothetical protein
MKFIGRLKYEGLGCIKGVCAIWEEHAAETHERLENPKKGLFYPRGVASRHTHIASTLKRAIHKAPTKVEISRAERETVDRWLQEPTKIEHETLKELYNFSVEYFGKPDRTPVDQWNGRQNQVSYPLPSGNACIGSTTKEGGTARALNSWMKQVRMEKMFFFDDPDIRLRPPSPPRDPKNPWAEPEERLKKTLEANITWSTKARIEKVGFVDFIDDLTSDPDVEEIAKECLKHCAELPHPPRIKVGSVVELGGKIRGISLHPPQVTHAARCLGNRMIASVKRKSTVREPLLNKPFTLTGKAGARLVSADLSKATDYFQHEMSWAIVLGCAHGQGWSEVEIDAAEKIYGPQELENGNVTRVGTHMGLAGTWAILNVANAFAAWKASTDSRSHKQCGDDLIGLFTPEQEQVYRDVLTNDLKLKYNMRKSYVGNAGRFCENHVRITLHDDQQVWASCEPSPKIAEIIGAQEHNGFSNNPLTMVPGLSLLAKHPLGYVSKNARQTLMRFERKLGLVPNLPMSMGGSGRCTGRVTKGQVHCLLAYLRTGRGIPQGGPLPGAFRDKLKALNSVGTTNGEIKLDDLRVHKLTVLSHVLRLSQGEVLRAETLPRASTKRMVLYRQHSKEPPSIHSSFLKKTKSRVRNVSTLQSRLLSGTGRQLRKLANALPRLHRCAYISKSKAYLMIAEDWEKCKYQNGQHRPILGLTPRNTLQ